MNPLAVAAAPENVSGPTAAMPALSATTTTTAPTAATNAEPSPAATSISATSRPADSGLERPPQQFTNQLLTSAVTTRPVSVSATATPVHPCFTQQAAAPSGQPHPFSDVHNAQQIIAGSPTHPFPPLTGMYLPSQHAQGSNLTMLPPVPGGAAAQPYLGSVPRLPAFHFRSEYSC